MTCKHKKTWDNCESDCAGWTWGDLDHGEPHIVICLDCDRFTDDEDAMDHIGDCLNDPSPKAYQAAIDALRKQAEIESVDAETQPDWRDERASLRAATQYGNAASYLEKLQNG